MRFDRLPLTYDECRARFRWAAAARHLTVESHPIDARGPHGLELSVDIARIGDPGADRLLIVASGTHGVEGTIGSALQSDLLQRLDPASLPPSTGVVLVHGVNPWGMAWWRRQNESNVDLNRNWGRDERADPVSSDHYDELHPILCPDGDTVPDGDAFLAAVGTFVDRYGLAVVRDAVSCGQYSHPDGLYFGGERTEQSTHILRDVLAEPLAEVERAAFVDLHTGHGEYATATVLCDAPPDSPLHRWLCETFTAHDVEATLGNPDATTGHKLGQLGAGVATLAPEGACYSTCIEFGTRSDTTQIIAGVREHWVHRHGDRDDPDHAAAVWEHRCCYTPDDPAWERAAIDHGRTMLDQAIAAVGR